MAQLLPQTLSAESGCFCAVTAPGNVQMFRLALLTRILESLGVTMTVPALMTYGKCYGCLGITPGEQAELALLDQIAQNIGTGTGGGGLSGVGSPEGIVTANPGATYLDTANGFFYAKQTGTGSTGWLAIVT